MARHRRLETLVRMKAIGVVPVFSHADAETAVRIVEACADGGATVVEFTNRADRAVDVFHLLEEHLAAHRPEIVLGAGSIVDAPTAALYVAAGASFVVGPLLDEETARFCNGRKVPYLPGCGTATEIHRAEQLGAEIVKIFPGDSVGGPSFVRSVRGPCPWTDLMPTGGVEPTRQSLREWFAAGIACAGIGSNLVTRELLASRDWPALTRKVRETVEAVAAIRAELGIRA